MNMPVKTIMIISVISALLILSFAGCYGPENPGPTGWQVDPAAQRSAVSTTHSPSAVESAIELSDKYAKLSEQAAELRRQNQNLTAENQKLKNELQTCSSQLAQTQKDLQQANDVLTETRLELNNWKENVLGFRDEMRDTQKAQLEALLKILKLLGAEPVSHTSANAATEEQK
jgi:chromosome segregation ATPase